MGFEASCSYLLGTTLEALLPLAKPGNRPRTVNLCHIINGILYILCTGLRLEISPQGLSQLQNRVPLLRPVA